jgi:hypothetical protein
MSPTPGPPQRVRAPAATTSSPQPGPPQVVAARWPGQASNAGRPLHRGLGRLAWRLLFAPQPRHPPAGNAIPLHQQHHPRCLPQQARPHSKQRAGHRRRRAAHQQPDRVALLAAGVQVGSGHGSSPRQLGRRAPAALAGPPGDARGPHQACSAARAKHPRRCCLGRRWRRRYAGGPTQRPRHCKERWRGVGVAAPAHGAVGGRLPPLGLDAPATPPGRRAAAAGGPAVTGPHGLPARIDLHASLPAGPLHPAGPVDPSTGGLPPRTLRGQGLSARQQPPARHTLTAPGPRWPGDSRSPEAGEDRCPPVERGSRGRSDREVMPPTPSPA